jgi:ABC-type Fe3+ transport system substrate-binding protein
MMRTDSGPIRRLIALMAVLALVVAACGSDGDGAADTTAAPDDGVATTETTAPDEGADTTDTTTSDGAGAGGVMAELEAAAQEESGELHWYYILGEEAIRPLIDAFEARYPFINIEVTGGPGLNLVERILSENETGEPVADVIQGGPLEDSILCGQEDLCFDYRPSGEANVPADQVFDQGPFVVPAYFTFHIVYNPDVVDEPPTSLEDLSSPEWAGEFGVDAEQIDWFAGELAYFGEEEGAATMEALAANEPVVYIGTQGYEQMASGALPAAVNMYSILLPEYIEQGAPMVLAESDHVIAQPDEFIGINSTDSPNTLSLFFEWLFTEEAQAIFPEHLGKTPMLPGIEVPDVLANACTGECELFFETSENFGDFDERVEQFQSFFVTGG